MLLDAAKLQEEEAFALSKRNERRGLPPVEPLYDVSDAVISISKFTKILDYSKSLKLFD